MLDKIKGWLTPEGIKEEKRNQKKTEQSEGAKELERQRKRKKRLNEPEGEMGHNRSGKYK